MPLQRPPQAGFTLIELLVAISLMALMALLSWRGLDGMTRTQTQLQTRADALLTLQAGLTQWGTDLDALVQLPQTPALDWDGRALRLTRRSPAGADEAVLVVAWARRDDGAGTPGGYWLRWQSPPLVTRGEVQAALQQATLWAQNPGDDLKQREVRISPLAQWSVFYYRGGAWSNPLSSDAATSPPQIAPSLPDGVRLVLTLPEGQPLSGVLTRDWMRPTQGGGKS
jgi:general secretion pathway protein J